MSFPSQSSKPNFTSIYESVHSYWSDNHIFEQSISERSDDNQFRFYDGPPFVTGLPHYGHLASSVAKDVIPRFQTMKGKKVDRVRGWDCHGIPIEQKVQAKLGLDSNLDIEKVGVETFINECYNYTRSTSSEWKRYIDQFARWVDFDNSYKTMDNDYMESVRWVFKSLWDKGLIYKGKRVSMYSTKLETPISNFEVAMDDTYEDVNDPAITVMFDLSANGPEYKNTFALVRTTTPWTIPVNIAAGVHKEIEYCSVRLKGGNAEERFIVASKRVEAVFAGKEYEIVDTFLGEKLVGLSYKPPFDYLYGQTGNDKDHKIYHADFVSDEDGTGLVHEAPEFGEVDFQLAKQVGLTVTEAMDSSGHYTSLLGDKTGMFYRDANPVVIQELHDMGRLFTKASITHRVAFCPRSGTPLVYKAQDSWFIDINGKQEIFDGKSLKEKCIEANEQINRYPAHNKHGRFLKSLETAPDRCISRTRYWGTPMPIYTAKELKSGKAEEKSVRDRKTKIILVRHGRTDYNEKKLVDSYDEARLSDLGKQQAEKIFQTYKDENIDVIYCSPKTRCKETIEPLSKHKGIDIVVDERITEIGGEKVGLPINGIPYSEFTHLERNKTIGGTQKTVADCYNEIKSFMSDIQKNHPGQTVVVSTHFDATAMIGMYIANIEYCEDYHQDAQQYAIGNAKETETCNKVLYLNAEADAQSTHVSDMIVIGSREELFQLSKNGSKNLVKHTYIRHGETDFNIAQKRDSRGDAFLTKNGIDQARVLGSELSSSVMLDDIIILSPLYRTLETATPLLQSLYPTYYEALEKAYRPYFERFQTMFDNETIQDYVHDPKSQKMFQLIPEIPVYVDFRLCELLFSPQIQGSPSYDAVGSPKIELRRDYEPTYGDKGEGQRHFYDRVESLINEVNQKFVGKQVVYFAHKGTGRHFIKYFKDYDFAQGRKKNNINNGEIKTFYRNTTRNAELDMHRPFIDDVWFEKDGVRYERISEVLDCWVESASMPYAQVHYPFENKEKFENSFPADYIVEYTGQIRAWFYVMHVLGVALFDAPAFKNVICHGVIAGNDGRKMSKSLGNFPDPKPTFEQYGGDAVRMSILTTSLFNGGDMAFSEDLIKEALKQNILPLWNAFYFFTTYANIDQRTVNSEQGKVKSDNLLDQRILSELSSLAQTIDSDLENYDLTHSSRQIALFLENLTNWYIRRSRRRFWKSENDGDKNMAYQTLYTVLLQFCTIAAPFMPILTEYIYRSLTNNSNSVHLQQFPSVESVRTESLSQAFSQAQTVVRVGLAARSKRSIRVRQPLDSLKLGTQLDPYFVDLIADELNIKKVVYDPSLNDKVMKICKPDGKAIGAKFGGNTKEIFALAKSGQFVEHADGSVAVGEWMLDPGSFEISYIKKDDSDDIDVEEGITMQIDWTITPELAREGYARDLVRQVQDARKEADYDIADRISLQVSAGLGDTLFVEDIINHHGAYIQEETLSTIVYTMGAIDLTKSLQLGDKTITIMISK